MTWRDLVRKYFPDTSNEEADFILWEKTSFPLGDLEQIEEQLKQYKENKQKIKSKERYVLDRVKYFAEQKAKYSEKIKPLELLTLIKQWEFDYGIEDDPVIYHHEKFPKLNNKNLQLYLDTLANILSVLEGIDIWQIENKNITTKEIERKIGLLLAYKYHLGDMLLKTDKGE